MTDKCSFRWCEFDAAYVGKRNGHPHYVCEHHYQGMTGIGNVRSLLMNMTASAPPPQTELPAVNLPRVSRYTAAQRNSLMNLRQGLRLLR